MSIKKTFADLGVGHMILPILAELGYETPTPVQEESIPVVLEGKDLLAQAQTGTGKTAAFALPILTQINVEKNYPQALVLAPTRELAIQVAESFQHYAKGIKGFHVLPIYGGQEYQSQIKALKRGVHVVVGTPGRVMDHLRRGTLSIEKLKTIVLDEADEMLNMGFIEDIEWILEQIKVKHQTVLFSATIPAAIRKVANRYLTEAVEVSIHPKEASVATIEQCYMMVQNNHKVEALTRFLEVETFDGILIFTRTKIGSDDVAEKLQARGYAAAAMNGDMNQAAREKVIDRIKKKSLDIIVATEVAARGLDIDRLSHVINYDIPFDAEAYVHRIGRTGRAGREGKSVLFVTPREHRLLRDIERGTRQSIKLIEPPSISEVNKKREEKFTEKVMNVLIQKNLDACRQVVEKMMHDTERSALDISAALVFLAQKQKPIKETDRDPLLAPVHLERESSRDRKRSPGTTATKTEENMVRCRVEVGNKQGVQPGEIVRVFSEKGDIRSNAIGKIFIYDDYSLVDLSSDVADRVIKLTQKAKLQNQPAMTKLAQKSDMIEQRERPTYKKSENSRFESRGEKRFENKGEKRTRR